MFERCLKESTPPILSYPTARMEGAEHVESVPWNAKGHRHLAQDSGAILRFFEGEEQCSDSTCKLRLPQQKEH